MTFGYLYLNPIDFLGEHVFLFYGTLENTNDVLFYGSIRVSILIT